jgi:hypothetical protein
MNLGSIGVNQLLRGENFMWKPSVVAQPSQISEPKQHYFKVQMRAWTNFDPINKSLAEIAELIEKGNGFLTMVEVLEVENSLESVPDEEVRNAFENILAAKRLMAAVNNLPAKLKEELRSALDKSTDAEVGADLAKKRAVSSAVDLGRPQLRVEDAS